jgi:hypothetical protein
MTSDHSREAQLDAIRKECLLPEQREFKDALGEPVEVFVWEDPTGILSETCDIILLPTSLNIGPKGCQGDARFFYWRRVSSTQRHKYGLWMDLAETYSTATADGTKVNPRSWSLLTCIGAPTLVRRGRGSRNRQAAGNGRRQAPKTRIRSGSGYENY